MPIPMLAGLSLMYHGQCHNGVCFTIVCVCARVIVWDHTDEDAQVLSSVIILAI